MACPFARQQTALWCNCTCLRYALLWRRCSCYGYHHANRLAKADIQQSSQRAQLFLPISCWRLIVQGLWWNASQLRCTRTSLMLFQRITLCPLLQNKHQTQQTTWTVKLLPSSDPCHSHWHKLVVQESHLLTRRWQENAIYKPKTLCVCVQS